MTHPKPKNETLNRCDRAHLAEYLSLLFAESEGRSDAEMARDICGIDPEKEPARAKKVVRSRLKRARWLADNPEALLADNQLFTSKKVHRSKPR